ncbi:FAD-dependent oxidoreductase [Mucilaginibacter sp.]|uniref:NAD(P)/FAD-dependent oxidoreductase n=1 Tax=Mucilaginibacter sp. TaxID=1882438 RepID=UPI0026169C86|nr:FAD-dependent oxidoreductase [Mucilaginibacter sp.]
MFQHKENLRFYLGELKNIVPLENRIETSDGNLSYDYLVLAMGTETNYFGMENIRQKGLPLKTIDDAINLRSHLLLNVGKNIRATDTAEKEKLQNIVIVGEGPTGVEISGMLAEMSRNIVNKDYPELKDTKGNIYLINSGKTLLGPMSPRSQEEVYKVLNKLDVKIKLNTAVKDYIDGKVILAGDETIATSTLVWASGVVAREAPGLPTENIGRGRRIIVNEYNQVPGTQNIFAIGDQCIQSTDKNYPDGHPQLAQVAIQ